MDTYDPSNSTLFSTLAAICALEKDVGPCRGRFTRWYYDFSVHRCQEFTYGGCRGNNNRFRSFEECHSMCVQHMREAISNGEILACDNGPAYPTMHVFFSFTCADDEGP